MRCHNCNTLLDENNIVRGIGFDYCRTCYDELFRYCTNCQERIHVDGVHYHDEDPYCAECFREEFDDNAPNNPHVFATDRELIIKISRAWLRGEVPQVRPIFINPKDLELPAIREKVGLVDNPIYVFGLFDREEFNLLVSRDLFEDVKEFVLINGYEWKVTEHSGHKKIGISLTLRKKHKEEITALIKELTKTKTLALTE
jgi:hypothetical protein